MGELIAGEWLSYATVVIPKNAPPLQVVESRRAFYAGASALFGVLLRQLELGAEPTGADLAMVDQVKAELHEFNARVLRGQA